MLLTKLIEFDRYSVTGSATLRKIDLSTVKNAQIILDTITSAKPTMGSLIATLVRRDGLSISDRFTYLPDVCTFQYYLKSDTPEPKNSKEF
jgi:hypothetical protein